MTTHTYNLSTLASEFMFVPSYSDGPATHARVATAMEVISKEARDFDAIDTKGRRFGARARILLETRTPAAGGHSLSKWVGQQYCLEVQALRDGVSFGGGSNDTYHATLADAQAAAEKYFAGAEQRALKNKARKA